MEGGSCGAYFFVVAEIENSSLKEKILRNTIFGTLSSCKDQSPVDSKNEKKEAEHHSIANIYQYDTLTLFAFTKNVW